jgi:hypothetical protein
MGGRVSQIGPKPLVALTIYPQGMKLGPAAQWLWALVLLWRARFDELAVVEPVARKRRPEPPWCWRRALWRRAYRCAPDRAMVAARSCLSASRRSSSVLAKSVSLIHIFCGDVAPGRRP